MNILFFAKKALASTATPLAPLKMDKTPNIPNYYVNPMLLYVYSRPFRHSVVEHKRGSKAGMVVLSWNIMRGARYGPLYNVVHAVKPFCVFPTCYCVVS